MRLKLYRAASVAEAMAQVRSDLGLEALIVSTRRTRQGVELTAALDIAEEEGFAAPAAVIDVNYHGIPDPIAFQLTGPDPETALASVLRFGPLPMASVRCGEAARPLLLAGMPGAGKTLSIARLATKMVLSGLRPVVITADGRRAGAAEELAAYTRLLGLELMVASTPSTLQRALETQACRGGTPVLIDTSGINPFDPVETAALADLAEVADATPVLVMAAGQHPGEAAEQAQAFAAIGVCHLLPTRLDLAKRLGSVIAAAEPAGLILTEAGIGAGVTDALVRITPAFLARRLLQAPRPGPIQPATSHADGHRKPVFPRARMPATHSRSMERHG